MHEQTQFCTKRSIIINNSYKMLTKNGFKNNYFIGGNFKNAVGIFVGGKKSLLLSIFESETKKT